MSRRFWLSCLPWLASVGLASLVPANTGCGTHPDEANGSAPPAEVQEYVDLVGEVSQGVQVGFNPDGTAWVRRHLRDWLDGEKIEAIDDAFDYFSRNIENAAPGLGVKGMADDFRNSEDFKSIAQRSQTLMNDRTRALAKQGLHWSYAAPTGAVLLFGGSWTTEISAFKGSGANILIVLVPYIVETVDAVKKKRSWYLSMDFGVTAVGNAVSVGRPGSPLAGPPSGYLESTAAAVKETAKKSAKKLKGAPKVRFGGGLIFGDLMRASDLKGFVVGVSGAMPEVPILGADPSRWLMKGGFSLFAHENNWRLMVFADYGTFRIRNVVATYAWEFGALTRRSFDDIHVQAGVGFDLEWLIKTVGQSAKNAATYSDGDPLHVDLKEDSHEEPLENAFARMKKLKEERARGQSPAAEPSNPLTPAPSNGGNDAFSDEVTEEESGAETPNAPAPAGSANDGGAP